MKKSPSYFLRPMHPKKELLPTEGSLRKAFALGWVAQLKIHGHRAQIHIPTVDSKEAILVYNRQGQLHKKALPPTLEGELKRLFAPASDWNVIDAEWCKGDDRLFVFDFLKKDGQVLSQYSFAERYQLLPRVYQSPHIETLAVISSLGRCMDILTSDDERVEGLVLRSKHAIGFADSSIVRCRKMKHR